MKIARLRLTSNRKRSDKSDAVAETEKCQPAQLGQRGDLKQLKVKSLSALLGQICDRKEFCLPFLRGCLLFFFFFSSRFLICARTPKIFLVHYSISGKYDYISHSIPAINRNDRQLKFKKKFKSPVTWIKSMMKDTRTLGGFRGHPAETGSLMIMKLIL